jgi:hypothetical protein
MHLVGYLYETVRWFALMSWCDVYMQETHGDGDPNTNMNSLCKKFYDYFSPLKLIICFVRI